jgi:hypothetical protein
MAGAAGGLMGVVVDLAASAAAMAAIQRAAAGRVARCLYGLAAREPYRPI